MPYLLRTKAAIADCETHLRATSSFDGPIEGFLTQYLLVLLCADVQQEICTIVSSRGQRPGDSQLAKFAEASATRVFRSVDKSEIANLAGMFGTDVRDRLNSTLDDRIVTLYGNAVNNRHQVAHYSGITVSFRDIQQATTAAESILAAFESALA